MDIRAFLRLAKLYSDLGWAVQDQLRKLVDGDDPATLNKDALTMCHRLLTHLEFAGVEGARDVLRAADSQ